MLGLWEVDMATDCGPMFALALLAALCFYSFRALLRREALGGGGGAWEAPTLANALGAEARRGGGGALGVGMGRPGPVRRWIGEQRQDAAGRAAQGRHAQPTGRPGPRASACTAAAGL